MAAPPSSARRPTRTPARPRITPSNPNADSGPPPKRRKYVPGGPGGGGRWVDADGNDIQPESKESKESDEIMYETPAPKSRGDDDEEVAAPILVLPDDKEVSPKTVRTARPRRDREREGRRTGRPAATPRPRYSSAAAAAAASQASDGYKPREERSWEEFHPDLDIGSELMVFTTDEVDGRGKNGVKPPLLKQATTNGSSIEESEPVGLSVSSLVPGLAQPGLSQENVTAATPKRKPGRPPRRPESMLSGLGSPPAPRIVPLPTHNPKERLNLPKPSLRIVDTFSSYERDPAVQVNFVDKSMANVGYQESDRFEIPRDTLIRHVEGPYEDEGEAGLVLESDQKPPNQPAPAVGRVEYDMDEQDERWLEAHNAHRKEEQAEAIKPAIFEITMTQIEKEYHALEKRIPKPNPRHPQTHRPRSSSAAAVNGEPTAPGDEPDSKCAICDDGDCENANAIIFCDGCDLAVHQECYGVPFIPEGQWFCRKCKEIGRGTPTCIFCPNVDGAFKQTNTLRWSHLLCAIWIPEVTIANPTFMEPIQDVDKVPRSRWSLNCYICNQKMGACIQCGNKACYQAFHVTCARRARLFLKMKSTHTSSIDASVLKAFCDRHVPPDWRREHDVDNAVADAKRYYRHTMRDRKWADSQAAALTANHLQPANAADASDELGPADDSSNIVVGGTKRKRSQPQKTGWRLPSGAPVVPAAVFNTVDASLMRFTLRKRKEFVAEACKYWTLKREARRGAALLKRLQLQLESFSSMEITRRNFAGMGAAGRPRLLRRIEFAELLSEDITRLTALATHIRQREQLKLHDVEIMKELVDTIYFPIHPMLLSVLQTAQKRDDKDKYFTAGLNDIEERLSRRFYTSVTAFSQDLAAVVSDVLSRSVPSHHRADVYDLMQIWARLNEYGAGTQEHLSLDEQQKKVKSVAKRVVKACLELLQPAWKAEADLKGIPYEKEQATWADLDLRLENSVQSRRLSSITANNGESSCKLDLSVSAVGGATPSPKNSIASEDITMRDAEPLADDKLLLDPALKEAPVHIKHSDTDVASHPTPQPPDKPASYASSTHSVSITSFTDKPTEPLSPPISTSSAAHTTANPTQSTSEPPAQGDSKDSPQRSIPNEAKPLRQRPPIDDPWASGGVPWYLEAYDVSGTTVHDERWTGEELMRAMSEPLSDMDEETLADLHLQTNGGPSEEEGRKSQPLTTVAKSRVAAVKAKATPANNRAKTRSASSSEMADAGPAEAKPEPPEETPAQRDRRKKDEYNARRRAERARNKKK